MTLKKSKASLTSVKSPVQAAFSLGGQQWWLKEGDEFLVNRLPQAEGETSMVEEVYLLSKDKKVEIGQPVIPRVKVKLQVLGHSRGLKIEVFKYKAKSRYRKRRGHRQELSKVRVLKIDRSS